MSALSRRGFLGTTSAIAASLAVPPELRIDPSAPLLRAPAPAAPVRIRGRVSARGRGLGNVAVSDGLEVVATAADGRFELVSDGRRRFVSVTPPRGHVIPRNPTGTARLYHPIRADRRGEALASFELEPLGADDGRHAFVVLADPQTQNAFEMGRLHAETVPDVQRTIRSLGDVPVFGMSDGDILYDKLELYGEYERAVAAMGIPFFQGVGNHDLDLDALRDEASTATFSGRFGPTYYSFNRGAVHYVVLDDVFYYQGGYIGYVPDDQLTWLAADLTRVERGSPVVVFLHIPLLSTLYERAGERAPRIWESVNNRDAVTRLLEPFRAHVIAGHVHEQERRTQGRLVEHILGATCGAWWSGEICWDGAPNGYGVFEVAGEEVKPRYQATGHPADHQIRLHPAGSDAKAPGEVIANVWDWDPSWTVTWYENGERKGLMTRRTGLDPASVREHSGPDLPKRRTWVDPVPTAHLFFAAPSAGAREVRVEAVDGFGRRYTAAHRNQ